MHRVRLLAAAVIFQFSAVHSHGQPLAGAGPGSNAAGSVEKSFQVKGVVKEVKPDEKSVVIQHEAVPGYMPAMTMPFDVRDTNELRGVQPGDVVSFRMTVTDSQGWIDHILRVAPG